MQPSNPPSFSYADPAALIASTLQAFLPPPRMSVPDWAAQFRYLSNEGGGYVGRWNHEKAPYLVGPMEALTSPDHQTIAIVGPGQCGKTAAVENWLAQQIDSDPADLLWFMQTQDSLEAYVKKTINPLIDNHARLLTKRGLGRTDDSLKFKRFNGMSVQFLAATMTNLVNKSAPRIVADEYDAYDQLDADPKSLLDVRRQTYGRESKLVVLSHPDRAGGLSPRLWQRGIMSIYADSDRRTWWWACPHCGCWSSPNPSAAHHMPIAYDDGAPLDDIAEHAHLLCPHHGCIIADADRRAMNLTGVWIGAGQSIDPVGGEVTGLLLPRPTAGFWIVGAMSPFILGGIGGLARARAAAERGKDATGDDSTLRQVVVKQWGVPYDPPAQIANIDAATLADRAEDTLRLATVPNGCRFITAAVDIQANRFEVLFRGWGVERESWVIDHWVIRAINDMPVDPSNSPADWDDVIDRVLDASFPLADGSGRVMRLRAAGVDSGGAPGVTEQAYGAWRRQRARRRAKFLGRVSGRDAWTLLLLKGASTPKARNLSVVMPDTERKDRRAAARGEIPLGIFNANTFKDALLGQFNRAEPGPGYIHFPGALRAPAPPHPFFEQLVAEERKPSGAWVKTAARNEALDLMVMSAVIAHLHAPSRFNWASPPAWAADWDRNPMVDVPAAPVAVQPAVAALPRHLANQVPPGTAAIVPKPAPAGDIGEVVRQAMAEMRRHIEPRA